MLRRLLFPTKSATKKRISTTSLQFRLTLELVLLSVLGLGGVAFWAGWQMEQNLVAAHKKSLENTARRFPEQLELYMETKPMEAGLKRTVDKLSRPGLVVWVRSPEGKMLERSASVENNLAEITNVDALMEVPEKPEIYNFGDRYVTVCGNLLTMHGKVVGKVFLSQDITQEQQQLNSGLFKLLSGSFLTIIILIFAISSRIRKATQPLQEISRVASMVSAEDLGDNLHGAKLQLQQAPDEILGLAQAFNEMLFRLSGSWEQQRQFVGNVSHELRTPLTVIMGYLQSLLRRSKNFSSYQQEALETAAAETERTIRMLQDLLDLARADRGSLYFRLDPLVLNTMLMEVAAMSQKVSNRQINCIMDDDDVVAEADRDRLQQVLINLVDNAIKYSDPESPVDLVLEKTPKSAIIHIRDRGIGISLSHQHRIFERFYRVDDSMTRSRDGTGLGLAIAKSLIEGMEGRITVLSKPGEGSTFTVTLPLWKSIL
jgi:signal transduction histidine kinase